MSTARQIVDVLLETDDAQPDVNIDPEAYLHGVADQIDKDKREGKLTPQTALTAHNFWHRTIRRKDGLRAVEARRNGATKTWKTRPNEFRIPIKIGMWEFYYITQDNADEWSITPVPDLPKPGKVRAKPVVNPSSLMPPL